LPVDVGFSTAKMPSDGFIYHGPLSSGADIELEDLTGSCVIRVDSGSVVASGSLTEIFFQPVTSAFPERCRAVGIVLGRGWSTPGVGLMEYPCYMRISKVNPEFLEFQEPNEPVNVRSPNFRGIPPVLTLPADVLFDFDRPAPPCQHE
jgi:hypothetical protein